jgi:hypothetical protein
MQGVVIVYQRFIARRACFHHFTMEVQHMAASGLFMQVVDVLGDDVHLYS